MFWHLRMTLAYKKTLGKFTKVLGFEKTPPPPPLGKIPKKSRFFGVAPLRNMLSPENLFLRNLPINPDRQLMQSSKRAELGHKRRLVWIILYRKRQLLSQNTIHSLLSLVQYSCRAFLRDLSGHFRDTSVLRVPVCLPFSSHLWSSHCFWPDHLPKNLKGQYLYMYALRTHFTSLIHNKVSQVKWKHEWNLRPGKIAD